MANQPQVQIIGLRELRRALKQVDESYPKELNRAFKERVATPAADRIRARMPARSGAWKATIRPGGNAKGAYVTWGRKAVPYAGWREFGGKRPRDRTEALPYRSEGRFVYPTVAEYRDEALHESERVLEDVARMAGFNE